MPWVETKLVFTTPLLLVGAHIQQPRKTTQSGSSGLTVYAASSGAAATIASDAFMNPFDGTALNDHMRTSLLF